MATASNHICTLCQDDVLSNSAVIWCFECEEWLCSECDKHHRRSKLSKKHKTIPVYEYENVPAFLTKTKCRCSTHNEKFELYCSSHQTVVCIKCTLDEHKECNLTLLENILENRESSAIAFRVSTDLETIKHKFQTIKTLVSERRTEIENQKTSCLSQIKDVRKSIDDHLDTIENKIVAELSQETDLIETKTMSLLNEVELKKKNINNLREEFEITKQFGNAFQFYMCSKELEKKTANEARYLQTLETGNKLEEINLELEIFSRLLNFEKNTTSFGQIVVTTNSSSLNLQTESSQGQIQQMPITEKIIVMGSVQLPKRKNTTHITGCLILPNEKLIFVDSENTRLVLYNKEGTFERECFHLKKFGDAYDICHVKNDIVAVTVNNTKGKGRVVFVDVTVNKQEKVITVGSRCSGVDSDLNRLVICLSAERAFLVTNLDGNFLSRINTEYENSTMLAIYNNTIFSSNVKHNKVFCHEMNGNLKFSYQSEHMISPNGVAIDNQGFVFVVCRKSKGLIIISPDGGKSKRFEMESFGLDDPSSLSINREKGLMLISNYKTNGFHDALLFYF